MENAWSTRSFYPNFLANSRGGVNNLFLWGCTKPLQRLEKRLFDGFKLSTKKYMSTVTYAYQLITIVG